MNAITDILKKNGAKVAYGSWKGTYSSEEFTKVVKEASPFSNIYVVYESGRFVLFLIYSITKESKVGF